MALTQKLSKTIPAQETFNYDSVEPELAKLLRNRAQRIKSQVRQQTKSIIETGVILLDVRARLEHGQFTHWVQSELCCSVRTAENYMRAATFADGKSEIVSRLPPATVYALAAPSTPNKVKDTVIGDLEAGRDIDIRAIDSQIRRAREVKHAGSAAKATNGALAEGADAAIGEVYQILREALSDQTFHRVALLLTCSAVVDDPTHTAKIFKALFALRGSK